MSAGDKPARGPRLRRLTEEEIDLWLSVAATVARRPDAVLPEAVAELRAPAKLVPGPAPTPEPSPSRYYAAPYVAKPPLAPPALAPLERKLKQKLARGRVGADAVIDLHGFRAAEAHSALRHFLNQAQRDGARIVLVVTGKGGRHRDEMASPFAALGVGVLKRSVPHWLASPEFRTLVIGFEEAGRPHGGAGALYVRLRRRE